MARAVKKKKDSKAEEIDFSKMRKVKGESSYKDETIHFYLSLKNRFILIILMIVALGIGAYYFINESFAVKQFSVLDYNQNGDIDYDVYLQENNFYSESHLESGKNYVSSLIDKVHVDFKYNYYLSEVVNLNYNYNSHYNYHYN